MQFERAHLARRAMAYMSLYPVLLMRALRLSDYDVVVTKTDPPMQFVLGPFIKAWTGQPLIHWAQDLYPDIAEAVGVIESDGWLARGLRRVATWALKRHDKVVAVGRHMKDHLSERGLPADRLTVIPNWPPDAVHPVSRTQNGFRMTHRLNGEFVVMYSGNMGLAHAFTPILDAAEQLHDRSDIVFLFVGNGPRKAAVEAEARRRELSNVRFLPFQPVEQLAKSLSAADVHLVTMQEGTEGFVVPSKLYGALAAGRPALFIGSSESEAARFVAEHDCGTVLNAPSGNEVAAAILEWKGSTDRREQVQHCSVSAVAGARANALRMFKRMILEVVQHPVSSTRQARDENQKSDQRQELDPTVRQIERTSSRQDRSLPVPEGKSKI
jgi:hypothetical protein